MLLYHIDFVKTHDYLLRLSAIRAFTLAGLPEIYICLDRLKMDHLRNEYTKQSGINFTLEEYYKMTQPCKGALSFILSKIDDIPDTLSFPVISQLYDMDVSFDEDLKRFDVSVDVAGTSSCNDRFIRLSVKKYPSFCGQPKCYYYWKLFELKLFEQPSTWKKQLQIGLSEAEFKLFQGVTFLMEEYIDILIFSDDDDSVFESETETTNDNGCSSQDENDRHDHGKTITLLQ